MEPLFFGSSTAPLYGVYHPPTTNLYRSEGVLLCYPAGQEYMRIHRAYRQLASMLSKSGFHVLRFDYSGTGDSHGDMEDANFDDWAKDTATAADELKSIANIDRLFIVGSRLGATVASELASIVPIGKLVLWEPFAESSMWTNELLSLIDKTPTQSNYRDGLGGLHVNGFHFTEKFCESLSNKALEDYSWLDANIQVLIVSANESIEHKQLTNTLQNRGVNSTFKQVQCLDDWNQLDKLGGLFLPQDTLHTITDWLETKN